MNPELLFTICNLAVMPAWALMVFAPRWSGTTRIVHSHAIPLALGVVYLYLTVTSFGGGEGNFNSLDGVAKLFANPNALLAGWIHYLAFDLFIGSWEARDAQRLSIPHFMLVPCLFLTLMMGPVGLFTYFGLRTYYRKKHRLTEPFHGVYVDPKNLAEFKG